MPGDVEQPLRALRLQIGRNRRQIDRRLRAVADESRRLRSWRTYVRHFPGSAALTALGAGLAFAAGLNGRRALRWLAMRMIRQGWATVRDGLWDELRRLWRDSTPERP